MDLKLIEVKLFAAIKTMACVDGTLQDRIGTAAPAHLSHLDLGMDPLYGELGERIQALTERLSRNGSWPDTAAAMTASEANAWALELVELYQRVSAHRAR